MPYVACVYRIAAAFWGLSVLWSIQRMWLLYGTRVFGLIKAFMTLVLDLGPPAGNDFMAPY